MTDFRNRVVEAMARTMVEETADDPDRITSTGGPLWHGYYDFARAALTALLSELDAAEWQIVPKVATEGVCVAGGIAIENAIFRDDTPVIFDAVPPIWTDMLAAAPDPFKEPGE